VGGPRFGASKTEEKRRKSKEVVENRGARREVAAEDNTRTGQDRREENFSLTRP